MVPLKTAEVQGDFKKVSDIVKSGEKVLVRRPRTGNIVILSEKDYKELDKAKRNLEYMRKLDDAWEDFKAGKVVVKTMEELEEMGRCE
ncbi:MAG: type II toxin-antitoxin system Phd/YefM family antitoxin [Oscillospiraceae bacterium]|nr:type II toxin-antitoxin system Phd/YefM family antitoxin [Oscillospiraceae bacterium]